MQHQLRGSSANYRAIELPLCDYLCIKMIVGRIAQVTSQPQI